MTISISSSGLWFLGFIFFFGCLTFSVHQVLRHGDLKQGLHPWRKGNSSTG